MIFIAKSVILQNILPLPKMRGNLWFFINFKPHKGILVFDEDAKSAILH